MLRERAPMEADVRAQSQLFQGMEKKVEMRPDLMVEVEGRTVLVADCKYKRLEPDQFRHLDVHQLLAYCTASDVTQGLLIYPSHEVPIRDEVHVRSTSVSVRQTTIDLGGSGEQLRQACDDLAKETFG
jgi:5-methylcytosine-specific restriction enzyme subunit McrC